MGHHFATADNSMRAPVVQRSNSHHGAGMDSSPHVPAGYTPGPSPNQAMLRSQVSTPSFSTAQRDQFLAQSAPSSQFSTGTFDTGQFRKPSSTDPRDYDWYYGKLSKETAVSLLQGKPIGTFLVRASSREGCYAASVVFNDGGVRHILIQPGRDGRYLVDALDNKHYNFKSIPAVIKSYSNILKVPCARVDTGNQYGVAPPY